MKIILFSPQIPQNTGNIARTCALTGCELVLVRPLGFSTSNRMLKRAGLDYWEGVSVSLIDDLDQFLSETDAPAFFFSSHATKLYTAATYPEDALLIFGSETAGLPPFFHQKWSEHFYTIPMRKQSDRVRQETGCLNLSNAASIVLYEALRQQQFVGE